MKIWEITGDDLRLLLAELADGAGDTEHAPIRIVRFADDEGELKVKVNEYGWSYGLGTQVPVRG